MGHLPGGRRHGHGRRRRGIAERVARFEAACVAAGRDPSTIRRSTWATRDALRDEATYVDFVERHRSLGFTDFSMVPPAAGEEGILRHLAERVIPDLRRC